MPHINFSIIPASQNILNGKVLIPKTTAKLHKALLMESDKEARDEFCHWIGMKPFYGRVNMASVKAKIEHVNSLLSESK